MELTSRRRSDEIPRAIEQLQLRHGSPGCVDICLASNIIEVGIDIDRLAPDDHRRPAEDDSPVHPGQRAGRPARPTSARAW